MSLRLRILRDTLLLAGAAMVVIVGGSAIAGRPASLFWLVRATPFIVLACMAGAVGLALLLGTGPARVAYTLVPAMDELSLDAARREADAALDRVGVQRPFGKAPDDLDAIALAPPSVQQFARDWGSLRAAGLGLEIDLAPVAERLRAAEAPGPGEARVPVGTLDGRTLLVDLRDGTVAIVRAGDDGAQPLVASLHHAVAFGAREADRRDPLQR
ncbi:MAG: hypothetical protein ACF8QF_04650 [Phycisphaerales bacterium]